MENRIAVSVIKEGHAFNSSAQALVASVRPGQSHKGQDTAFLNVIMVIMFVLT